MRTVFLALALNRRFPDLDFVDFEFEGDGFDKLDGSGETETDWADAERETTDWDSESDG